MTNTERLEKLFKRLDEIEAYARVVGKVGRRWPFSMGLVAYDPSKEK